MRITGALVVIGGLAAALRAVRAQPKPDAEAVMAAARQGPGGEKRRSAVKSFSVAGRTQQARGTNSVPNELEMLCERPDRCARTDEHPARGAQKDLVPLTLGMFAGSFSSSPLTFSSVGQAQVPKARPRSRERRTATRTDEIIQIHVR